MENLSMPTLKLTAHGYDIVAPTGEKLGKIKAKRIDYMGRKQIRWFWRTWGWGDASPSEALKDFNSEYSRKK